MATQRDAKTYLFKQLGEKSGKAVLQKIDRSAKKGLSAKAMERVLTRELDRQIKAQIVPYLNSGIKTGVREAVSVIAKRGAKVGVPKH